MLQLNSIFKNYEGFKQIFTVRESNEGKAIRSNSLLLSQLKHKPFREFLTKSEDDYEKGSYMWRLKNIAKYNHLQETSAMIDFIYSAMCQGGGVWILDLISADSDLYETDDMHGICEDGDTLCVRYINKENGRVFKMKAGKFFRKVLMEQPIAEYLCPQIINYACEDFAAKFSAKVESQSSRFTLRLGSESKDFEHIYSRSARYKNQDFHSCMTGTEQHYFYSNAVKAKAAWLEDADRMMHARCVIFTNVHEVGSDKVWRLAERQYSCESDQTLMRTLICKLIAAGEIDGYKKIGVNCHEGKAFVSNLGEDLSERDFYIDCNLDTDDTLSYQDSFKYYNMRERIAYNHSDHGYDYGLDTTDSYLQGENYDEYHDEYTNDDVITVYYRGREYTCNENDLDDFRYVYDEDEYHHEDDVVYSRYYDRYYLADSATYVEDENDYFPDSECYYCDRCDNGIWSEGNHYYSDITECDYCCEDCMRADLKDWIDYADVSDILDNLDELRDNDLEDYIRDNRPEVFAEEDEEDEEIA